MHLSQTTDPKGMISTSVQKQDNLFQTFPMPSLKEKNIPPINEANPDLTEPEKQKLEGDISPKEENEAPVILLNS